MRIKRNKEMIHFSGRRHTKLGICSMIIGILSILGLLAASILSGIYHGQGGIVLGVVGIGLLALSVFGFVLSYKAFKKKDIFYRFPIIGAVLNGFMTILLFVIYILGIGG
jgi:hypothetical protein